MEQINLARNLSLQILHTRSAFRKAMIRMFRANGIDLTFEMLQVMYPLWQKDGVTQQQIADAACKDKGSMVSIIDNLVKRGLVERCPDPKDRRNNLICLTEKGRQLGEKAYPLVLAQYYPWNESISDDDLKQCIATLQRAEIIMKTIYNQQ